MAKLSIQLSASMTKLRAGLKNAQKAVADWKTKVARIGKVAIGVGVGAFAAGLAAATKRAVQLAAQFQQTQVAFRTMVGDSQKAAALIDALTEFSTKTPFTPEQVQKAAKTLLAFGFAADDVKGTMKILGDVSAGTGKDLSEMAVIFGQIKSAGRLMGQDLLQLINAGFNPLQVMSEKTGKSMAQLKDEMSKGLVTFEDVRQAFVDATSAGGIFFNMMEEQSGTLGGKLSTLQGNWDELLKTIGAGTTGPLSQLVDKLNEVAGAFLEIEKARERASVEGVDVNDTKFADRLKAAAVRIGKAVDLAIPMPEALRERMRKGIEVVQAELEAAATERLEIAAPELTEQQRQERSERARKSREDAAKPPEAQVSKVDQEVAEALKGLDGAIGEFEADLEGDMLKQMQEDLKRGDADIKKQKEKEAAELEKQIGLAFRPQGEIASNLSRIGGERGIAVARNVPEKQLAELKAINKGIEIMADALKSIDATPVWPGK